MPPAEAAALPRHGRARPALVPPGEPIYVAPRRSDLVTISDPLVHFLVRRPNVLSRDVSVQALPARAGADRRRAAPRAARGRSCAGPTRRPRARSPTAAGARAARARSTSTSRPRTGSTRASAPTTCSCRGGGRLRRAWGGAGSAVVAAVAVPAASAGSAWAGTYDVVSCGAPGAGGVNRAWAARSRRTGSDFSRSRTAARRCSAASSAEPSAPAPFFTSANWTLQAPVGHPDRAAGHVALRPGASAATAGSVAAYDGERRTSSAAAFGETCTPPQGLRAVHVRRHGRRQPPPSRVAVRRSTRTSVFYSVGCGVDERLPRRRTTAAQRYAEFHVYGTAVTRPRRHRARAERRRAAAAPTGWHRPADSPGADLHGHRHDRASAASR